MINYKIEEIYNNNLTDIELQKIINKKIYNIINNQEMVLCSD